MILAWGDRLTAEERSAFLALCDSIQLPDASMLSAAIMFESEWKPYAHNPSSDASGLIQFMPRTATGLGTTVEAIRAMSRIEQFALIRRYFAPYIGRIQTIADCYMAILWPAAIGKPDDWPLFAASDDNAKAYMLNRGLDINRDGTVTKAEATARVETLYEQGLLPPHGIEMETVALPIPITQPEAQMPAIVPFLMAILPSVMQLFAPKVQQQLSKVTGQPPEVAGPLLIDVFTKMGQLTGVLSGPTTGSPQGQQVQTQQEAVQIAGAMQKAAPEVVQQVETHIIEQLDKFAPMLDRLFETDKWVRQSQIEGQSAAMQRQLADQYKIVPLIVRNTNNTTWALIAGLSVGAVASVVCKAVWPDLPDYAAMIIPALTMVAGQIMKERGAQVAYYFDGTPTSNAAQVSQSIVAASLPQRNKQEG